MAQYDFYTAMIRFITHHSDRSDARVDGMMQCLDHVAECIEDQGVILVPWELRELTARSLAGMAALLQEQVLPSAVADNNRAGEMQIRWAVDTSMEAMTFLLRVVAEGQDGPATVTLPPPPAG